MTYTLHSLLDKVNLMETAGIGIALGNWLKRLIGLLISLTLTIVIFKISMPRLAAVRQDRSNVPAGELLTEHAIGQTFRAPFSNLYRIDVLMATYERQNQGPILFHLAEEPQGESLVTIKFDAAELEDNAFYQFRFEPIADSAGRDFFFYFEAPNATPGNAVTIWQTDYAAYARGQAYVNGQPVSGDLRFIAYYRSGAVEIVQALSERMRIWNPYVWRLRWPLIGVIAAWIAGVGMLLGEILIASSRKEQE